MKGPTRTDETRLLELLADRAAFGLSAPEAAELAELLRLYPSFDEESIDRAAATVELASMPVAPVELPEHLRKKIAAAAHNYLTKANRVTAVELQTLPPAVGIEPAPTGAGKPLAANWLVIAASVLIALGAVYFLRSGLQENPAQQYRALLAMADRPGEKVIQAKWIDPAAADAKEPLGDLVWNPARQRGYMRFRNLPENDPKQEQYQLWIFDAKQDERYPIDGGVFDIRRAEKDPQTGDVIVPIDAKLRVEQPTMFAVTIEKPGGVVVSGRERLPRLAKVE